MFLFWKRPQGFATSHNFLLPEILKLLPIPVNVYVVKNINLPNYRSGTVNSKSFVGKVLLRIKWKFELN